MLPVDVTIKLKNATLRNLTLWCSCHFIKFISETYTWPNMEKMHIYYVYMASFALSRYHIWITSSLVPNVVCWVSTLNEPMRWPPRQEDVSLWRVRGLVCMIAYWASNSVAMSDVLTSDLVFWETFLMSDVLATNLMLSGLLLFSTFLLFPGWK